MKSLCSFRKSIWSFFLISLTCSTYAYSQTIVGKWKAYENGRLSSLIEIYAGQDGRYYGKMIEIYDADLAKKICEKCPGDRKNKGMKNLVILRDLKISADKKSADGGLILAPDTGKEYNCKIWLEDNNTLKMRAYVGFLYGTRTWEKAQ
ncbi:MAG: DUF2147 domain-containing protein [Microscillaceae bacterium]|nr:DUF2147 domain-containing protein [Microscillaceae bacterium]